MEYPKFKVCCRCFTFNQSKYITDAMNGFTMQQTSFPFVCCIVDDASTDGEQEVIRKYVEDNFDLSDGSVAFQKETDYAHITYAQHKMNKNCYFAVLYLKENHYSQKKTKMPYLSEWRDLCEYEALCEGDDYWIDSLKIEKQFDYMESHPNCGLIYTYAKVYKQLSNKIIGKVCEPYIDYRHLLMHNCIATLTVMYKLSLYDDYLKMKQKFFSSVWKMGDYPLWLYIANKTDIQFIPDVTSIYRILRDSASHGSYDKRVDFLVNSMNIALDFDKVLCHSKYELDIKSEYNRNLFIWSCQNKNKSDIPRYFQGIQKHQIKDYIWYIKGLFKVNIFS